MKSQAKDSGTLEGAVVSKASTINSEAIEIESDDVSTDELQEFLAADYLETRADGKFKESLRRKLWAFVEARHGRKGPKVE